MDNLDETEIKFLLALGQRYRAERERLSITVLKLAVTAGVSYQTIYDVESGNRSAGILVYRRLAHAMGQSLSYFFAPFF